ncbi:MAG: hypothetical protein JXR52_05360 [Bacteroidales bacterium]|nr:hypothetical protein [Bacteroidales bacterium]
MKFVIYALSSLVAVIVLYLALGYLSHRIIFREKLPSFADYFRPGDQFSSKEEGLAQRVIEQKNGRVYCEVTLSPFAPGPPVHVHTDFDEVFEAGPQGMHLILAGDTMVLKPYETFTIQKGIPHKPFNPTGETLVFTMKSFGFPEEFAVGLVQMYGFMDSKSFRERPTAEILLQGSLFSHYFDSWLAEPGAPPVWIQKTLYFFIRPFARMKGYRSYYQEFGIDRFRS